MSKIVEKHLTVKEETFNKIKELSKIEKRPMRTIIEIVIDERYSNTKKEEK